MRAMQIQDFDFEIPDDLIAQYPARERSASRLLWLDGTTGALRDARFRELPDLLRPGDLMVFNDTRVIKARLCGVKDSGGEAELLIERVLGEHEVLAQVSASHAPKPGSGMILEDAFRATVLDRNGEFYRLRFEGAEPVLALLEKHGRVPLPPYIRRAAGKLDAERYQAVYARNPGAVAAPTAGLHFDQAMMEQLAARGVAIAYVTLHVGAGTFQPVRAANIADHRMHSERFYLSADSAARIEKTKKAGGRILAVGSSSLRALEAAAGSGKLDPGWNETDIFITPGYRFKLVERLLTNFHLPRSTLFMLVSAFGGLENMRRAYRHAVAARYRFFSYGDAMLIERGAA